MRYSKYVFLIPITIVIIGLSAVVFTWYKEFRDQRVLSRELVEVTSAQTFDRQFCGCDPDTQVEITSRTTLFGDRPNFRCLDLTKIYEDFEDEGRSKGSIFEDELQVQGNGTSGHGNFARTTGYSQFDPNKAEDSILYYADDQDGTPLGCLFGDVYSRRVQSGTGGQTSRNYNEGSCCPAGYVSTSYFHRVNRTVCCFNPDVAPSINSNDPLSNRDRYPANGDVAFNVTGMIRAGGAGLNSGDVKAQLQYLPTPLWRNPLTDGFEDINNPNNRFDSIVFWSREADSIRKTMETNSAVVQCQTPNEPGGVVAVGDYDLVNLDYFLTDPQCSPTPTPVFSNDLNGCFGFLASRGILDEYRSDIIESSNNNAGAIVVDNDDLDFNGIKRAVSDQNGIEQAVEDVFGNPDVFISSETESVFRKMCSACRALDAVTGDGLTFEEEAELNACITCENSENNIWTDFGCIEATGSGIVNWINRLAIGLTGFVIIIRGGQMVMIYLASNGDSSKAAEAREIAIATGMYLLFIAGGYIILRFLAFNIVGIDIPIF